MTGPDINLTSETEDTIMEPLQTIFSPDYPTEKPALLIPEGDIANAAAVIEDTVPQEALEKGKAFSQEITERFIADFEKPQTDLMAHVSTFLEADGIIYMTYYTNTESAAEDPNHQCARLAYCPSDDPAKMTVLDIQAVGDICGGRRINLVYDTILARADADTLYILWTAMAGDTYYRLYRPFYLSTKTLGEIGVNRFRAGKTENDFSTTGIVSALSENGLGYKKMFSDIGIMQKFTTREEDGVLWYYTGTYSGDWNAIIKSRDFITWEFVAQPDFPNHSLWENAVYVLGSRCFYFVRQHDTQTPYGFLTVYDLEKKTWDVPVLIADCQSRSDFLYYRDRLYLFHAPIDREHIGIVHVDTDNIANSRVLLQAKMDTSCFYPFIQFMEDGGTAMSYTVARKHIRMARFSMDAYV